MQHMPHEENPLYSTDWTAIEQLLLKEAPKVVYDIGANEGKWTERMWHYLRVPGIIHPTIHLFEPVPDLAARLVHLFRPQVDAREIHVHPCALGDTEEIIQVNGYNCWTLLTDEQALSSRAERSVPFQGKPNFSIHITKLDTVATIYGAPNFVKMDVDGYEVRLLRGARRALAHRPPVLFELWDGCQKFLGDSVEEMCNHIYDMGYKVWNPTGSYCCPDPQTLIQLIPYGSSYDVMLLADGQKL